MPLIQAEQLTKIYGSGETAVTALDHVDLVVEPGEFVAIMGPSGCGKSTLLHLLGGLDRPTSGRVLVDGKALNDLSDDALTKLRRLSMGFVFQFYNLIPVLNACENAALPVLLDGVTPADALARSKEWLERVGLGDKLRSRPDQLSGGQQQRVAVARALVAEPKLVLADEPTGNLDSRSSDEIAALLRQVADEWGRAVIMVTHDARIAAMAQACAVHEGWTHRRSGGGRRWEVGRRGLGHDPYAAADLTARGEAMGMNLQLTLAARYLWGRKLRSLLTTVSITVGAMLIFAMNMMLPTMMKAFEVNLLGRLRPGRPERVTQDRRGLPRKCDERHPGYSRDPGHGGIAESDTEHPGGFLLRSTDRRVDF